jgi:2-dehydro-3-deoxy-D-arabinonate dehydratase
MSLISALDKNGVFVIGVKTTKGMRPIALSSWKQLLQLPLLEAKLLIENTQGEEIEIQQVLPPVDKDGEVWAAGVTYLRSRDARTEESGVPDVYTRVYEADRPEIFFKAIGNKVVCENDWIGIRYDSKLSVPEPEIALLVNSNKQILGLTICNDVTSRTIEGENPLYLPQAKMYEHSCSLFSEVVPIWEFEELSEVKISAEIIRSNKPVWQAETSLGQLKRSLDDLVDYLYRCYEFTNGVVFSTGTGIVPPMETFLIENDQVAITVGGIGTLSNTVKTVQKGN